MSKLNTIMSLQLLLKQLQHLHLRVLSVNAKAQNKGNKLTFIISHLNSPSCSPRNSQVLAEVYVYAKTVTVS